MKSDNVIYQAEGINKHFPGIHALKNVNFELRKGEIHGIVGHNGAGKSTLVKVLTGVYTPESGKLILHGDEIKLYQPKDAIDRGIGIVTQEGTLIDTFSALQNIFLGKEECKFGFILNDKELLRKGRDILRQSELNVDLEREVGQLSPAQRKIVEILKIMIRDPKVFILDESTASLSGDDRMLLFDIMKKLRNRGVGIIFITHYLDEVLQISDRITIMRDGQVVGMIENKNTTKAEIVRLMINKEQGSSFPEYERKKGEMLLEVEHISDGGVVKDVSLSVRRGEVIGLFGTVGSGRTEFCETLFGFRKMKSGTVKMHGKKIKIKNVRAAIKNGMALIPDDRLKKALMLDDPVVDNITLPFLKEYARLGFVKRKNEYIDTNIVVKLLDIMTPSICTKVNSLSGGNKQKVSFGRWITSVKKAIDLYIFDEPTEGVDIGTCAEMYKIIANLVKKGSGCIVISSDLSEIIGLSDRIYIMRNGQIVGEVDRDTDNIQHKLITISLSSRIIKRGTKR